MLPQEIQVWYVLPSLRKELATALISHHGFSQKKVAEALGVSEGAVSQYLSSKRGMWLKFDSATENEIGDAAARISSEKKTAMEELMRLSELASVKKGMCRIHMEQDKAVPKGCDICFK